MSSKNKEEYLPFFFVLEQLHSLEEVSRRSMFGGYGLYLGKGGRRAGRIDKQPVFILRPVQV